MHGWDCISTQKEKHRAMHAPLLLSLCRTGTSHISFCISLYIVYTHIHTYIYNGVGLFWRLAISFLGPLSLKKHRNCGSLLCLQQQEPTQKHAGPHHKEGSLSFRERYRKDPNLTWGANCPNLPARHPLGINTQPGEEVFNNCSLD